VPLMLDKPAPVHAALQPPWLDQDTSHDVVSGRVLAVKCRLGGVRVDSWPMPQEVSAKGGVDGAEAEEQGPDERGACTSGESGRESGRASE